MREILFRGKRIDNGEWIEGLLWKKKYDTDKLFIRWFPDEDDHEEMAAVFPETVGQYIGLREANGKGKKIFEGDIVKAKINGNMCGIGCVEWNYTFSAWFYGGYGSLYDIITHDYEVIGNIHDNPELLKGGDQE